MKVKYTIKKEMEITDSEEAYNFCRNIEDRPEVRKLITESYWAYYYCRYVEDRPSVRKLITFSGDALDYCKYIKDRPKIRKLITDPEYLGWYEEWKKRRL
jgi:hypothetical protein